MKRLLRDNTEWVLGFVGILFTALLVWVLIWGVVLVMENMTRAFGGLKTSSSQANFDLDRAKQLDFKGLTN